MKRTLPQVLKNTVPYLLPFVTYVASLVWEGVVSLIFGALTLLVVVWFWKVYALVFRWRSRALWTGVILFLLWVGVEDLYHFTPTTVQLLYVVPGFILVAPFVEELFFRKFLLGAKPTKKVFPWLRLGLSALLYALFLYPRWITGLVTALVLTWLYYKERKVEPLIIAHVVANVLIVCYAVLTNSTYLFY